MVEEAIKVA